MNQNFFILFLDKSRQQNMYSIIYVENDNYKKGKKQNKTKYKYYTR